MKEDYAAKGSCQVMCAHRAASNPGGFATVGVILSAGAFQSERRILRGPPRGPWYRRKQIPRRGFATTRNDILTRLRLLVRRRRLTRRRRYRRDRLPRHIFVKRGQRAFQRDLQHLVHGIHKVQLHRGAQVFGNFG
jgi:hypothetical protein